MKSLSDTWELVLDYCKKQITEVAFDAWLNPLKLIDLDSDQATIEAADEFPKKIVSQKYAALLKDAFSNVMGFDVELHVVTPEESGTSNATDHSAKIVMSDMGGDCEFTFDTFVVGSSNRFAHAAAQSVASNPGRNYNPLFIHGNSGLGKTHLLNAICYEIKQHNPQANIIYTRGEDFTNELINFLSEKNMVEFHNKYRSADILLIDDIQFISGKISTQEEFFHTFDSLFRAGKQIVLTSDRPPKEIQALSDRLRSRFESGLIADIQPPDMETRMAIIIRKAKSLDLELPDDVVQFISEKIKNNIRQLEGTVKKIKAYESIESHSPSIVLAQNAIRDILSDTKPLPVTIDNIISEISRTFAVSGEDIKSKKRDAPTSRARQVAMYVVREITGLSTEAIGAQFGNRDHSTVIYALRQIEEEMKRNSDLRATITDVITNIKDN